MWRFPAIGVAFNVILEFLLRTTLAALAYADRSVRTFNEPVMPAKGRFRAIIFRHEYLASLSS